MFSVTVMDCCSSGFYWVLCCYWFYDTETVSWVVGFLLPTFNTSFIIYTFISAPSWDIAIYLIISIFYPIYFTFSFNYAISALLLSFPTFFGASIAVVGLFAIDFIDYFGFFSSGFFWMTGFWFAYFTYSGFLTIGFFGSSFFCSTFLTSGFLGYYSAFFEIIGVFLAVTTGVLTTFGLFTLGGIYSFFAFGDVTLFSLGAIWPPLLKTLGTTTFSQKEKSGTTLFLFSTAS